MPTFKFILTTLAVTAVLDSSISYGWTAYAHPELITSLVIVLAAKLLACAGLVGLAMWGRSAWRGRHG